MAAMLNDRRNSTGISTTAARSQTLNINSKKIQNCLPGVCLNAAIFYWSTPNRLNHSTWRHKHQTDLGMHVCPAITTTAATTTIIRRLVGPISSRRSSSSRWYAIYKGDTIGRERF